MRTLAFPLTPGLACSHCVRVLGAVAWAAVERFSLGLDVKDYKGAALAHMPFLTLVATQPSVHHAHRECESGTLSLWEMDISVPTGETQEKWVASLWGL